MEHLKEHAKDFGRLMVFWLLLMPLTVGLMLVAGLFEESTND